ncbi:MAG: 1-pyrroline-5-carboxylate dehydrogenase, partial [Deltaproteobacteria bacterium CG07_land_8_20_14_0_80_38_7]
MPTEFRNEPFTDFTNHENKKLMESALTKVASEFDREYPIVIGKENIITENKIKSFNPSNKTEIVGIAQKGT